jgi:hypothetical protein
MTRPEDREKEVKTEQKIVAEKVGWVLPPLILLTI